MKTVAVLSIACSFAMHSFANAKTIYVEVVNGRGGGFVNVFTDGMCMEPKLGLNLKNVESLDLMTMKPDSNKFWKSCWSYDDQGRVKISYENGRSKIYFGNAGLQAPDILTPQYLDRSRRTQMCFEKGLQSFSERQCDAALGK